MVFDVHQEHAHFTRGHLARFEIIEGRVPGQLTVVGFEEGIKVCNDPTDYLVRNTQAFS